MKEFKTFVGIDISKKTVDAAVHQDSKGTPVHQCFDQSLVCGTQNTIGYSAGRLSISSFGMKIKFGNTFIILGKHIMCKPRQQQALNDVS